MTGETRVLSEIPIRVDWDNATEEIVPLHDAPPATAEVVETSPPEPEPSPEPEGTRWVHIGNVELWRGHRRSDRRIAPSHSDPSLIPLPAAIDARNLLLQVLYVLGDFELRLPSGDILIKAMIPDGIRIDWPNAAQLLAAKISAQTIRELAPDWPKRPEEMPSDPFADPSFRTAAASDLAPIRSANAAA